MILNVSELLESEMYISTSTCLTPCSFSTGLLQLKQSVFLLLLSIAEPEGGETLQPTGEQMVFTFLKQEQMHLEHHKLRIKYQHILGSIEVTEILDF